MFRKTTYSLLETRILPQLTTLKSSQVKSLYRPNFSNSYLKTTTFSYSDKKFKNPFNFDTTDRHEAEKESENPKLDSGAEKNSLGSSLGLLDDPTSSNKTFKKKSRVTPSASEQSARSTVNKGAIFLMAASAYGLYCFFSGYTEAELSENPKLSPDDSAISRARARLEAWKDVFFQPKYTALLPPSHAPAGQPLLTLVLELDETLVKLVWDRDHGYRIAKRPGLDHFLGLLFQLYEVVIFTSMQEFNGKPIMEKLDPYQMYHHYFLSRDATSFIDGKIVKDLSHLSRDLSQVIIMDSNPDSYSLQVENSIQVPAWDGSPEDRYLIDILPFLLTLVLTTPSDVRTVLEKYRGQDIPSVFRAMEENQQRQLAQKQSTGLRRFLGGSKENVLPLTPMMARRQELELNYEKQKDSILREHKEYFDKMREEELKLLGDTKMTAWNVILKNFAPPPDSPEASHVPSK